MALTKLYQVVDTNSNKVWQTKRTQEECEEYLSSRFPPDYMRDVYLTIRPIWTNSRDIESLLEK